MKHGPTFSIPQITSVSPSLLGHAQWGWDNSISLCRSGLLETIMADNHYGVRMAALSSLMELNPDPALWTQDFLTFLRLEGHKKQQGQVCLCSHESGESGNQGLAR